MKIIACTLIISLSVTALTTAQEHTPVRYSNSVYLEVFGNGGFASFNYEYNQRIADNITLSPRFGIGIIPVFFSVSMNIPLELNLWFGYPRGVEIGGGATFIVTDVDDLGSGENRVGLLRLGYRSVSKRGFLFKIAFTPAINEGEIYPHGGISIGKSF